MRSFLAPYDVVGIFSMEPSADMAAVAYRELTAKKNAALAGWIAWVTLQDPNHPHLGREAMATLFGEWCWRAPVLVREGERWLLRA